MTDSLVTVLTTTYNHARFIADCIRSVQAQSFKDYEHVIVDDGSTDGAADIISGFDDERITYVRQKHVGVHRLSETYNRGLKLARGEFIAVVEGDDMIPRHKLERQLAGMGDAVLSFGKCQYINEKGRSLGVWPRNGKQLKGWKDWLGPLLVNYYLSGGTVMLRKDALQKIGGFIQPKGTVAVDYSTYLELALIGKFKFINEMLGVWRKHGGSYSDSALGSDVATPYVIPFCKKHGIPIPWKKLAEQKGRNLFHVARHQLLNGDNRKALDTFKRSFTLCSGLGKVKSLGGMAASVLNMDLENIAEKIGRPIEK
jgi:glycosyltransferase involved in cell wall biosynthesis